MNFSPFVRSRPSAHFDPLRAALASFRANSSHFFTSVPHIDDVHIERSIDRRESGAAENARRRVAAFPLLSLNGRQPEPDQRQ